MFAPKLYKVRKLPASVIINSGYDARIDNAEYTVSQGDNMMFRLLRNITGRTGIFVPYIVFVDCNGSKSKKEEIKHMVVDGFMLNGVKFVMSERSASMTRNAILGFIDASVAEEVDRHITMDLEMKKTVLSKWCAYRGLMFSSCHCLDGWYPKTIVVPDYETVVPHQKLRWLVEEEREYTDKETGEKRVWKTHGIEEGYKDVPINVFDGHGFIHPALVDEVRDRIGMEERPTTMMLRAPFIKGLVCEIDYTTYYHDHDVDFIQDVWGKWHSVDEPMIVLTVSMYKGFKYFKQTGTYQDWDNYWSKFQKYGHCWGVAKWNFTEEQEPVYTRGNYQILQDLDLPFEEFQKLASKSINWAEKIVNGDPFYTYCFLGLANDNPKPLNNYARAVMKNPEMMKEQSVRDFLKRQVRKYIDSMKCGKIYLKACYKFLIPDLIMMLEWIGGDKNPKGALEADEFWAKGYEGEHAIERNPHICKSEHLILKAKHTEELERYCGHLVNTCMLNGKSPSPQRMNGADYDGDLVLLMDEPLFLEGADKDCAIVLNLDEKLTALAEDVTIENIASLVERTLVSLIGEDSNAATCYHNKITKKESQQKRYETYVDILSIVNSFAIDFAKTGYIMQIPFEIAKYSKPYPYFMRYVGEYYNKLFESMERTHSTYRFSRARSNMNQLAFMIEKFHDHEIKWKRMDAFDYTIMLDEDVEVTQEHFDAIESVYKDFNKEMKYLITFENKLHRYDEFKDELKAWDKESAMNYHVNWDSVYSKYRNECSKICPDKKELANIAVKLCYEKYPKRGKKFIWSCASEGVLENIKQVEIALPVKNPTGEYAYLGKRYSMISYTGEAVGE